MKYERIFRTRPSVGGLLAVLVAILLIGFFYLHAHKSSLPVYEQSDRQQFARQQNAKSPAYFISPQGDDKSDGRSQNRPLKTINKALASAQPGDTIKLLAGAYHQNIRTQRAGTAEKPIIIQGSEGTVVYGEKSAGRITLIAHSYVWLEDFTIDGKIGGGSKREDFQDKLVFVVSNKPKVGVRGVRLNKMLLQNAGGECLRIRYLAQNNEISDSTIKNCGRYDFVFNDGGKNGEGIYLGTAPEQLDNGVNPTSDRDVSANNWIHNNIIETNGNECVDIKEGSHDNLVEENSCSGQKDPDSGGLDARGSNNTFRNNSIFNNVGAGIRLGGDSSGDGINNNVYGNTIKNNESYGIKILRLPQGKLCDNKFLGNGKKAIGGSKGVPSEHSCQ